MFSPLPARLAPLSDPTATPRSHATAIVDVSGATPHMQGPDSDRVVGTLVHRLLEHFAFGGTITAEEVQDALPRLLEPDELVDVIDLRGLARRAATGYAAVCSRPDVQSLCASGARLHEVPFTMATEDGIVRGTIDCLIRREDGNITILEFKTGRPRPEHRVQLDLYKRAAAQLFAGAGVDAVLVYADAE